MPIRLSLKSLTSIIPSAPFFYLFELGPVLSFPSRSLAIDKNHANTPRKLYATKFTTKTTDHKVANL